MNLPLKLAIVASRQPAYTIAATLGITDTRLSKIVYGRLNPKPEEKRMLSEILDKPVEELFSPQESGLR